MSYNPFGHLGGLQRIIEEEERMRRQLEGYAQPLLDAARRAEEIMRPLQDSLTRYQDIGRRLSASFEVNTPALALAQTMPRWLRS